MFLFEELKKSLVLIDLIVDCYDAFYWTDRQQPDSLFPKKRLRSRVAELNVWLHCGSWLGLDLHDVCMRCASSS